MFFSPSLVCLVLRPFYSTNKGLFAPSESQSYIIYSVTKLVLKLILSRHRDEFVQP